MDPLSIIVILASKKYELEREQRGGGGGREGSTMNRIDNITSIETGSGLNQSVEQINLLRQCALGHVGPTSMQVLKSMLTL